MLLRNLIRNKNLKFYSKAPKRVFEQKQIFEEPEIFEEEMLKKKKEFESKFEQDKQKFSEEVKIVKRENIEERIRKIETLISKLPEEERPKYNHNFTNLKDIKMVDETGKFHNSVSFSKSLRKAQKHGLELVLFGPEDVEVPLFKIIDLEQFLIPKVEKVEQMEEIQKKISTLKDKEYQLRSQIGDNDLLVKINHIKKNLLKNYRVTIVAKGHDSMKNLQVIQKVRDTVLESMKQSNIEIAIDKDVVSHSTKSIIILRQKL
eukprot:gene10035-2354_t